MNRKQLWSLAAAFGFALALLPAAAGAQAIGTCTTNNTCSIETRLPGQDLCNDGIDNDGNGATNLGDMHCQSEVLCEDGFDNDGDGLTDVADEDCRCMDAAYGSETNCTANDLAISYESSPIVGDGCINSSDTVTAQLFAQITLANASRYNLGMWVSLDGGSAKTSLGACTRQTPQPVSATPDPLDPLGDGPFYTLDGNACGDGPPSTVSLYKFPYYVNVPCTDTLTTGVYGGSTVNGFIDLGQCGSWDNNAGGCSNPGNTEPNTKAKCRCVRAESTIPGPNVRMGCDNFFADEVGATLDAGETGVYQLSYTNDLSATSCVPSNVNSGDLGRTRCGTASFIQFVVNYYNAKTYGDFFYSAPGDIEDCDGGTPLDIPGVGLLCDDTANNRLVWVPVDANASYDNFGVISPFAGTTTLEYQYERNGLTFVGNLSFDSQIYWSGGLDADENNSVTADEALSFASSVLQAGPTLTDNTCTTNTATTPITLASFRATPSGRGVQFDWSTQTEAGNVGFNLYSQGRGGKVRLNESLIPTESGDSLLPQQYSAYLPVPDDARRFSIEDVDIRGVGKMHGPFELDRQYGAAVQAEAIDWVGIRQDHGVADRDADKSTSRLTMKSFSGAATPKRTSALATSGTVPSGPIELHVDRSGLYRVTYEDLFAAGFDLASESATQIALTEAGKQVPIYVNSASKFGPGSYFEFWGEALDTLYTDTNVYRLITGQKKPARAEVNTTGASGATATAYFETRRLERNRSYAFTSPLPDPFYDTRLLAFTSPAQWQFGLAIEGYVPSGGPARIVVEGYGGTSFEDVAQDHHVEILLNGALMGEARFDGLSAFEFAAEVPAGVLQEGNNSLVLRLPADTGAPFDIVYFEGFSIAYPREIRAQEGRLAFSGSSRRFDVTGLPTAEVSAYRVADGSLVRLGGVTVNSSGADFTAVVPGDGGAGRYAVASGGSMLKPAAIRAARPAVDIRTGPASYLVIAHGSFVSGIQPLADARAAQGHSVKVVDVEDVYSQFSGGVFDADAIRRYIAYAKQSMGTRHVLLVGGDTYDYRNYLGLAPVSFIPSLYRATSDDTFFAPSDAALADVDGDSLEDLAIGRLPVRTAQELANVVQKTLDYDVKGYGLSGVFVADFPDGGANRSFSAISNGLVDALPAGWQAEKIYLETLGIPTGRANFFAAIDRGSALTYYLGHSGTSSWGSPSQPQSFFTISDVAKLTNSGRPTAIAQFGCWNNYYVSPRVESIGSRLVLSADKGAAVVLGAVTLSKDINTNRMGALLAPRLVEAGRSVGEALIDAKRELAATAPKGSDLRDILHGWVVLGDPALVVSP